MDYKDHVTAGDLLRCLSDVPSNTIIDIAIDPEINQTGPIAMSEKGALDVLAARMRDDGTPVLILWPTYTECLDDRYEDDD